jgi:hypothetical protein
MFNYLLPALKTKIHNPQEKRIFNLLHPQQQQQQQQQQQHTSLKIDVQILFQNECEAVKYVANQ